MALARDLSNVVSKMQATAGRDARARVLGMNMN